MSNEITYRFHVYVIDSRDGRAKLDFRTDEAETIAKFVIASKKQNLQGYVWDSELNKASEQF